MAENLGKRPSKGILKTSSSFEKPDAPKKKQKETKWDEMNIIATLHPPDKDYGHMKIEEPKTPFNWVDSEGAQDELDAAMLAEKIMIGAAEPPKSIVENSESEEESEEEEEEESEEAKEQRMAFESKRKAHYNEYHAVKLARKLMERDEEADCENMEDDSDERNENDRVVKSSLQKRNKSVGSDKNCLEEVESNVSGSEDSCQ